MANPGSGEADPVGEELDKINRRSGWGKRILWIAPTLVVLAAVAAGGAYLWAIDLYERPGPLQAEAEVQIPRGSSLSGIAERLQAAGVIDSAETFTYAVKLQGAAGSLQAGDYAFTPGISMQSVVGKLTSGDTVQYKVTVPEGRTSWEVVQILNAAADLSGPRIEAIPEEGTLLPDTYFFKRGVSRQDILDRMAEAQADVLAELWPNRQQGLPVETKEDWVTLASIVEKETGLGEERPLVASVFVNRLHKGMRLQSDPTVIYAVTKGIGGPLGRGIRWSELRNKDPYNTYTNDGLPPGPIANPGRAALEAVLHPAESDYLFFVADGTGGHAFARTNREHEANVREWRKIEKELRARQAEEAGN